MWASILFPYIFFFLFISTFILRKSLTSKKLFRDLSGHSIILKYINYVWTFDILISVHFWFGFNTKRDMNAVCHRLQQQQSFRQLVVVIVPEFNDSSFDSLLKAIHTNKSSSSYVCLWQWTCVCVRLYLCQMLCKYALILLLLLVFLNCKLSNCLSTCHRLWEKNPNRVEENYE